MSRWLLSTCVLLLACSEQQPPKGETETEPAPPNPLHVELQQKLDAKVTDLDLPGAVLAVSAPGVDRWVGATGLANVEADVAMVPDDLLGIASITKTFTAAVVMQLRDEGSLSLGDLLSTHCPACPFQNDITVEQLLRHTSGLDDFLFKMTITEWGQPWEPLELMARVEESQQSYFYANTNFILLGMVIESVTGNTWEHEVATRLLDRHDLVSTFLPSVDEVPETARGYSFGSEATDLFHPSVGWSAGSMVASADDVLRWLELLRDGDVVPFATFAEMSSATTPTPAYGLGLKVFGDRVGHDGDAGMFRSEAFCEADACVVAIVNASPADSNLVADVAWDVLHAQ